MKAVDLPRFRLMGDDAPSTQQDKNRNSSLFIKLTDAFYMKYIDFPKASIVKEEGNLYLSEKAKYQAIIMLLDAGAFEDYEDIRKSAIKEFNVILPSVEYIDMF